jgi:transposase
MRQLDVRLNSWQRKRLIQLRDHGPSPRISKRAICLLRSDAGDRAAAISRVTGLSLNSVANIRRRWRQQGLRSLTDRSRTGRPRVVTDAYLRQLRRALRRGPRAFGYVFTVWSVARLRAHLQRLTGITISTDWLRRLTHKVGWSIGRPKHTLANKRNGREYEKARKRLETLKRGRCKRTRPTSCGTRMPRPSSSCRI